MFAPAINVQQIDEILPALIESLQVVRNFFAGGELAIVRIDLVSHPAKVFDSLAFARVEGLNYGFALRLTQLVLPLLLATLNITTIERTDRHSCEVETFGSEAQQQRRQGPVKSGRDRGTCHAPKIQRLFESLFHISKIDLRQVHLSYDHWR